MRFTEIINPEDQLALWRLISDKVWSTFGQTASLPCSAAAQHPVAPASPKAALKSPARVPAKPLHKGKATAAKKGKPKRAPMAAPPKPLPKPKPLQPTKTQSKQYQQFAHQINRATSKNPSIQQYLQPNQSRVQDTTSLARTNNSYSERDMDELVLHRRDNPLKPLNIQ